MPQNDPTVPAADYALCPIKNGDTRLMGVTSSNLNRFSKFFTDRLLSKSAIKLLLNIPQVQVGKN